MLIVFDGDTVGCDLSGDGQIQKPEEHIRLLGIDTPETSHSKRFENDPERAGKDQPYAQQARMFLDSRIKGQTVFLAFDVSRTDRYGRTLAFVYADEATPQSLNETMLKEGYATLLFIAPNRKHYSAFEQAETEARRAQRGLWRP